jgi:hypothetical protein
MLYLESSNRYTTSSIQVPSLSQATETYLALRGLKSFQDAVWTLRTERYWLHDHANGLGEPEWWYEVSPNRYAPYRDGRPPQIGRPATAHDVPGNIRAGASGRRSPQPRRHDRCLPLTLEMA